MSDVVAPETGAQIDSGALSGTPEGGAPKASTDAGEGYRPPREKRYREERNAARTERDAALTQVESLHRREVERLAGEGLAQPADLLSLGGVTVADLLGEDGYIDPEAVAEAVAGLVVARPGLAKNPRDRLTDLSQGSGNGPVKGKLGWDALFRR